MNVTREQVIAEARSWMGTPWQHQASLKGVGTDCKGLLTGIARSLEIPHKDVIAYGMLPNPDMLIAAVEENCGPPIPANEMLSGDILIFRMVKVEQHFGLLTSLEPRMFVHAWARQPIFKVVENSLDDRFWLPRLLAVYRFPGIQ